MIRRVLATLTALLVVVLALLVWQLSQGPLSLAFVVPYLEDAIHGEHDDWRIAIGDLALMTDLKIHARDVELLAADGTPLLRVPDAAIRPSLRALLYGMVAVSAVEVDGAQAHVVRRADGSFGVAITEPEPADAAASSGGAEFLEDLLDPVGTDHVIGFLRHFRIGNARLTVEDLETRAAWTIADATIALARGAHRHQLTVDAGLVGEKPDEESAHLEARLDVRPDGEGFVFDGSARATGIEAARLALYWPQNAAVSARRWVTENIRRGRVSEVDLKIAFASTSGTDLHLTKLSGNMRYEGLEVRWGDDVPPVVGVSGTSAFDRSSMRFTIAQASLAEIRVRSGRISLFDLDTDAEHIAIEVKGDGPIAGVIGLAPEAAARLPFTTTGDTGLDVQAAFPLRAKLSFADVDLKVDTAPRSVAIHHERAAATVSGSLRYQKRARRQATLSADLEIEAAHFDAGGLRWTQPAGKRGAADFQLALGGESLTFEPLRLDCPGLRGRGVVTLGAGSGGTAQLSNLVFGDTELDKAQVEWRPNAIKVRLGRGTVDLSPLFGDDSDGDGGAGGGRPTDLDIETGVLRRVSLEGRSVENVEGKLLRQDGIWQEIDVGGELPKRGATPGGGAAHGAARKLTVRLAPTGTGWRLEAAAGDFGGLLYAAGLHDGIHGGALEISGRADRAAAGTVVRSHVKVTDFVVRDAPLALRILSVAALDRLVSTLKGDGLHFDSLKGTVIARGNRYELEKIRAHGSTLGWTANGWFDTGADQIQVDGTVIPAYQANKVLRKVPFLGGLLTGRDRGALIAINYSVRGNLAAPKVSTNALSALTPGFLREVWDLGN